MNHVEEVAKMVLTIAWADEGYPFDDHPEVNHWDKNLNVGVGLHEPKLHECTKTEKSICLFDYVSEYVDEWDIADMYEMDKLLPIAKKQEVFSDEHGAYSAEIEVTLKVILEFQYDFFGVYDDVFWFELVEEKENEK